MQLPDIDGHEVLRRLRADERHARASPASRCRPTRCPTTSQRALQAGFDDYWTKPLDLRAFMRSLDTIFGAPAEPN